MVGNDLRSVIVNVRSDGRSRNTHCPAHEDHRASLSISRGDDGRILLFCHANCPLDAILAAVDLKISDLFETAGGTAAGSKIIASYAYHDTHGELHFQVVRFEPKSFRQRRPDGQGGWIWNTKGLQPLLYHRDKLQGRDTIIIAEGEKDCDRLWTLGLPATCNAGGASKWKPAHAQQLKQAGAQAVGVLPDNDAAGRQHAEAVAQSCHTAGLRVRIVELPDLPPKGDVSNWLDAGHTREELIALAQATAVYEPSAIESIIPPRTTTVARTLTEVEDTFAGWIRDQDHIPTRAVLAAYVANRKLGGDPVWLMLVGGSGVGKTERLIPLAVMPDVVLESSITGPAALLSGTGKRERSKDATGGLLRKLPEGRGVLLLKDFTSIIDMHRESRAEVLAALREIYDGRWDRSVGAEGGRTLTWTGHAGLLAGCTTAIDSAHSVLSIMGTRFMLIRLQGDQDIAGSAFDHVGQEQPMREQLRAAVRGLLEHLPGTPYDKAEVRAPMIALAKYVALGRSPVDRDSQGEIRLVLDAEAPTRIIKSLTQLWRACGLLGLDKPQAWELVHRVGMDSIPKLRRAILDYLAIRLTAATTTEIAEYVEHPSRTTRRGLEDLAAHRVVRRLAGGEGKADRWALMEQAREWLNLQTLPVSSGPLDTKNVEPIPEPHLIETQITNDDITGKVSREVADDGVF